MSVHLVRQEDSWGCMIASCAMVLGQSYQETKALIHPWHRAGERLGIGMGEMDGLLVEHGFAIARRFEHYHAACCHRTAWPPAPFADVHICEVITSAGHAVVMLADGRVLDPAFGDVPEGLKRYSRIMWVAGVHRVSDLLPEFVGPTTLNRCRPRVCMCAEAWDGEGGAPC